MVIFGSEVCSTGDCFWFLPPNVFIKMVLHFSEFRSHQEGGLLLDRTANHFFLPAAQRQGVHNFLKNETSIFEVSSFCFASAGSISSLADIPPNYELDEARRTNRAKDPLDVFVLVKEYISSETLSQPPMLVLPAESKTNFPLVTDRNLF